ncbi:unnamed protein product, partial [Fusarium graminearum]
QAPTIDGRASDLLPLPEPTWGYSENPTQCHLYKSPSVLHREPRPRCRAMRTPRYCWLSCITLYRCSSNFKNPWRKSRVARVPCPTIIYLARLYCSTAFISFRLCQSISDSAGI